VADRCGANNCAGQPLDPIMEFDAKGNFIKAFGKGLFNFPHGFFIDAHGTTSGSPTTRSARAAARRCSSSMSPASCCARWARPACRRRDPDTVLRAQLRWSVARDGTIFVADGHTNGKGSHRIVKFDASGKFLKQWGTRGAAPGQLEVPHSLALDSKGPPVRRRPLEQPASRSSTRAASCSRPGTSSGGRAGVFIDRNDVLYVADSESRSPQGYGHHPGWKRGIRIGSARTGAVTAFIPDTEPNPDGGHQRPEGIAADGKGAVYGAQVLQKSVVALRDPALITNS
jgi:hypothetical protein